jgi:Spy/CpxP family protein refolding chaperone
MRHTRALLAAACLLSVVSTHWIAAQQARPVSTAPTSMDEMLTAVREDMQTDRSGIMGKNLSMTAEQATRFWTPI